MNSLIASGSILEGIGVLGFFFILGLAALYILFPIIVILQLWALNEKAAKQNKLMRQLLRAYGHEPEA